VSQTASPTLNPAAPKGGALELVCVRCTRARWFPGATREDAGREAESKGWALINGKVYCNRCPHPIKVKPQPAPPREHAPQLPTRIESTDEIINRLVRDGLLIKNAAGLVCLSPQAQKMKKADMARLLRPRGI
jgi:hypothetical protein